MSDLNYMELGSTLRRRLQQDAPPEHRAEQPRMQSEMALSDILPAAAEKRLLQLLGLTSLLALGTAASPEAAAAEPRDAIEAKRTQIDHAFHEPINSQDREELVASIGEKRVVQYETMITNFPYDAVIQHIAVLSGLPPAQLYQQADLQLVFPYSAATLDNRVTSNRLNEYAATFLVGDDTADQKYLTFLTQIGGISIVDRAIGINLERINMAAEMLGQSDQLNAEKVDQVFAAYLYHTIVHELVHALDEYNKTGTRIEEGLYEGSVDTIASQVMTYPENNQYYRTLNEVPYLSGYGSGKPAGRFLALALEPKPTAADVMRGDKQNLMARFDGKYGEGAWASMVHFSFPALPWTEPQIVDRINEITPLYALMTHASDAPTVLESLKEYWPGSRIIPLHEDGALVGVAVRDEDATFLMGGVVFREKPGNKGLLLSLDMIDAPLKPLYRPMAPGQPQPDPMFYGALGTSGLPLNLSDEEVARQLLVRVNNL